MTVNIILEIIQPTPEQSWAADYDRDGDIDIIDAVGMIQYILG